MENNININIVPTPNGNGFVVEELALLHAKRQEIRDIEDRMDRVENTIIYSERIVRYLAEDEGANSALLNSLREFIQQLEGNLSMLDEQHRELDRALGELDHAEACSCEVWWMEEEEGRKPQMRRQSKDWRYHDYDYDE